jgi:hypothetical protein
VVITWPRNERWTDWISPDPPHVAQVRGEVPGAQPDPVHVVHTTAVSTFSSRRTPNAASSSVNDICSNASAPGRTRLRRLRPAPAPPAPPPKNASKTSPNPPKPENGLPAPAPPLCESGSPPRSTMRRFSGSDSTS